ncbi:CoB--CoM heterodisulfide reductase iron-sulfur subunit B family protein [Sporomusa sp. KB1]|jgi:heterodisulfide reductase subunit B|uniref:CoB--CoM heterodisulfide reductase iron-sulfur subunit B family protein n=1 Tax=Sporomusa sp. KB1 TaxID=943346 RepID=UPI0011A1F81D|nr:CoB--CoM heterodisulfide reductase iron-sulfur subunit B family protein [Sporomusa sp. KB1]TWH48161.1 heterodisulfide reductase subunit B [Sporomusa sp. KB1]
MKLGYYPGCSLHSTAAEYNMATEAVFDALDLELAELPEWNCCGATAGHSTDRFLALALPLRNLVIAEAEQQKELILPCAACYNLVKAADHYVREGTPEAKDANEELQNIMGSSYKGTVHVTHPLEVIMRKEFIGKVKPQVKNPLKGLKVVPYYGCLLTRPTYVAFDDVEQPQAMDQLMNLVGADVKRWSYKTDCCGGSLTVPRTDVVYEITKNLVTEAQRAGADAIVTACPLCQMTLETRQKEIKNPIPIFFFTELLGISFGHPQAKKWMKKHIIDPIPLLTSLHLL